MNKMATCQVCRVAQHKYKCPRCVVKYCSTACYKTHACLERSVVDPAEDKRADEVDAGRTPSTLHRDHQDIADDRVPLEKLELLRDDSQLLECLKNPHLRAIVSALDVTTQPDCDVLKAMREPIFAEFVDNCLRVVEPVLPHEH